MKKLYIVILLLFVSCNTENSWDCVQTAGTIVKKEITVPFFSQIRIENEVALIIKQGSTQEVIIETGKNLLPEVTAQVIDEVLVIKDKNNCNFVRDYGITKAIVTTPDLKLIRNSSQFNVTSQGVLNFAKLTLVSNTTLNIEGSRKSGDFTLNINAEELIVQANGFSAFYISGVTEKAQIVFEDEIPKFEGENLSINHLKIFQRSANNIIVRPLASIEGVIRGTGNVISLNRPPVINVEEYFTGRLIFQD